ncbi:putative glycan biosynthesis protein [Xylogone sp. PMI_703]|nr:putative glycan biosynthesis protein [Xylogone sp. PMI_703]
MLRYRKSSDFRTRPLLLSCIRRNKRLRRFFIFLAYLVAKDARLLPPVLRRAKNLLIVTAHPDDECLFFAPSILGVLDGNPETVGSLLVMSTGNNYGAGETRKKELKDSCAALRIESKRCIALDQEDLQDNPKVWWDQKTIIAAVKEYVERWQVDAIITFDQGGISGHLNHRAVSKAISTYGSNDPNAPAIYVLQSASLSRKYTFLLDLPLTSLPFSWRILCALFSSATSVHESYGDKALIANTWHSYMKTRQAFASHDSQYSWDRHLYMILSRQVWFNDLRKIELIK